MTSANVSKMTASVPVQTNAAAKTEKENSAKAEFSNLFNSAADRLGNTSQKTEEKVDVTKTTQNTNLSRDEYDKYAAKEDRITQKSSTDKDVEKASKEITEFSEKVSEEIEETLGVSKEQLEEAMSELGLTFVSLLNPANLAALATKLTGSEDSLSLIMNADFQGLMQTVELLGEELTQELGISVEELNQIAASLEEDFTQTMDYAEASFLEGETSESAETVQAVGDGDEMVVTDTDNTEEETANIMQTETAQSEEVSDETSNLQNDTRQDTSDDGEKNLTTADEQHIAVGNTQVEHKNFDMTMNKVEETPIQQPVIDTEDILRQISDFTRVTYNGDATTMEMQLNPEHLGKLYIQISSKEGAVTANIAAQNEIAKEALESQVAMLKENLNQQGIKVEAVEVTIASHEFERNLEENQQNRGEEEQREQAAKNARRSISLDNLDELSGLMSEEEMLAARIMRDNGNSVDFSA